MPGARFRAGSGACNPSTMGDDLIGRQRRVGTGLGRMDDDEGWDGGNAVVRVARLRQLDRWICELHREGYHVERDRLLELRHALTLEGSEPAVRRAPIDAA